MKCGDWLKNQDRSTYQWELPIEAHCRHQVFFLVIIIVVAIKDIPEKNLLRFKVRLLKGEFHLAGDLMLLLFIDNLGWYQVNNRLKPT